MSSSSVAARDKLASSRCFCVLTDSLRLQAALASTLMSQGQSNPVHGDIFGQPPPGGNNFGLPNTNLGRMSADAIMGGSYFTHQLGRTSADGGLDPAFQYSALSRRSADASLPVGRNLPQRYTALPFLLSSLRTSQLGYQDVNSAQDSLTTAVPAV